MEDPEVPEPVVAGLCVRHYAAASDLRDLVLRHVHLIDGIADGVQPDVAVVVRDGRIAEIVEAGRAPAGAGITVVEGAGAYVLPGLWDVHVHFEWPRLPEASIAELTLQYAANAYEALTEAGVTAVRTAGTPHLIDVAL